MSTVPTQPPTSQRMHEPLRIKNVTFKNRVLRSSLGGKLAHATGEVDSDFTNFEKRFARSGVAGLVSATITVDDRRWSPLNYAKISADRFVPPFQRALAAVKAASPDCAYIVQIGDPGYETQTSLFSEEADARSASDGFDLLYGYRNTTSAMTEDEIALAVRHFADGARRVKEMGADGLEITASKGYLIHQFLNPGINRRRDKYGGSPENRFRLLREIIVAVRAQIGPDFLLGVRLSAADYNYLPVNVRLPVAFPVSDHFFGNRVEQMVAYGAQLEQLGVDYLHITRGFGFINPKENPGAYPLEEIRIFANYTRHLSAKANLRAGILNTVPDILLRPIAGIGWNTRELGMNADYAAAFKKALKIPIIANGGFQSQALIEQVLSEGKCDMVSMARPLLANPDLLRVFAEGKVPAKPCTFCNRCAILTSVFPVGCYDRTRFTSQSDMEAQILGLLTDPDAEGTASGQPAA